MVEKTKQAADGPDEGMSQVACVRACVRAPHLALSHTYICARMHTHTHTRTHPPTQVVQILLLASTRAFVGTVTSNFGQLVTKLMGFATPAPVALDLSCVGLTSMRNGSSGIVWAPGWAEGDEARCRRASRSPRNLRVIS